MADVGAARPRRRQAALGVQVRPVHVDLAAALVRDAREVLCCDRHDHETAAARSYTRVDSVTVPMRRVDAIEAYLKFNEDAESAP